MKKIKILTLAAAAFFMAGSLFAQTAQSPGASPAPAVKTAKQKSLVELKQEMIESLEILHEKTMSAGYYFDELYAILWAPYSQMGIKIITMDDKNTLADGRVVDKTDLDKYVFLKQAPLSFIIQDDSVLNLADQDAKVREMFLAPASTAMSLRKTADNNAVISLINLRKLMAPADSVKTGTQDLLKRNVSIGNFKIGETPWADANPRDVVPSQAAKSSLAVLRDETVASLKAIQRRALENGHYFNALYCSLVMNGKIKYKGACQEPGAVLYINQSYSLPEKALDVMQTPEKFLIASDEVLALLEDKVEVKEEIFRIAGAVKYAEGLSKSRFIKELTHKNMVLHLDWSK
jgi:hypothetical protein